MNLKQLFLTKNNCYIAGKKFTPKGIMVHATGANNPNLRRYVGPDDGQLGVNTHGNHWNQPTPDGRQVCVHAFIGRLADGTIATYQALPWDMRGWHCGSGQKGSGNDTHISFEICEDGLMDAVYFNAVYREAVELCATLCEAYGLDPMADGVLIDHSEGFRRGIASNHGDVRHWFPGHGKSMEIFRADVKKEMEGFMETVSAVFIENGKSKRKEIERIFNREKGVMLFGGRVIAEQAGYTVSLAADGETPVFEMNVSAAAAKLAGMLGCWVRFTDGMPVFSKE